MSSSNLRQPQSRKRINYVNFNEIIHTYIGDGLATTCGRRQHCRGRSSFSCDHLLSSPGQMVYVVRIELSEDRFWRPHYLNTPPAAKIAWN